MFLVLHQQLDVGLDSIDPDLGLVDLDSVGDIRIIIHQIYSAYVWASKVPSVMGMGPYIDPGALSTYWYTLPIH